MKRNDMTEMKTLADLKKSGYAQRSVKQELRDNLIVALREGRNVFEGIIGFEDSVVPQLQAAILSRHNIILLGLRGQAKTRLARLMINLLDEYIPVIRGSEVNDDPFSPISHYGKEMLSEHGDATPIDWVHRSLRYSEKLATPDVSVADLIGDVDPIKAANRKLDYSDERVIHFGMIARANRGLFVINELPDLQARIQVALFNILQEGDLQIRGFKFRLPLDIQFVFTANPEDYTNRGSIVTPLKDRIGSQILTHYPSSVEISTQITRQEAKLDSDQMKSVEVHPLMERLIERVAFEARKSEFIDQKSGVSARLTISALENLISVAERRMLINKDKKTAVRISDIYGIVPAITGKIELVYEGEVEGISSVAYQLIGKAIREEFLQHFDDPGKIKKSKKDHPYNALLAWFSEGNEVLLSADLSNNEYGKLLKSIPFVDEILKKTPASGKDPLLLRELLFFGLAEFSQISRTPMGTQMRFRDIMSGMLNLEREYGNDEEH